MLETIQNMDGSMLIKFQSLSIHDSLTPIVKIYTHLGDTGLMWIVIAVLLLIFKRTRKYGLLMLVSLALTYLVNNLLLKELIDRTRPYEVFDKVQRLIEKQRDPSFPSGHSASSFAAAMCIYLNGYKRYGIPLLLLALLMTLSRLYVGVHYPGDVVTGAIIGSLMAWLVYKVYDARQEALHPAKHRRR
ncbi:MAG: phosphatase PAP2 family protein [Mogibacterium diversum]|uniref:phosphatase PAP2 family protein n=1 Tax=Mogibacterium diversum TaxID=114527 RepID=UPI001CAE823A|nr:phosphatase PAP2 family protein [Mogibacterium diversum]MBF1341907.1 phosphatase PAP2 family protein [Mogibacterium diversum]